MARCSIAAVVAFALAVAGCGNGQPGKGAPDPGGNPRKNVRIPPPHGRIFGFNTALGLWAVAPAVEVRLERLVGAQAQRYGIPWRTVQARRQDPPFRPGPGAAGAGEIDRLDLLYRALVQRRMTPIITVSDAPAWATGAKAASGSFGLAPDRSHLSDWSRYVAAVAARYPRAVIEPWNEPNLKTFWHSGPPDPVAMARLQCSAYRAVKRLSRGRTVLSPGFAVTTGQAPDGSAPFTPWGDRFYERARRCFDAVSAHIYGGNQPALGAGSLFAAEFEALRRLRRNHGDRTPIWITETGGSSIPGQLSEAEQSRMNVAIYNRLMTMRDVHAVVYNTLRDARDPQLVGNPGAATYHFGFLRERFGPKPVYCAFAAKARKHVPGC